MTTEETIQSPTRHCPPTRMPVLPLRDVVVYPHMVIPLFVGREKSILALEQAMKVDKQILLLAQKQADVDDPARARISTTSARSRRSCSCSSCRTAPSRCWSRASSARSVETLDAGRLLHGRGARRSATPSSTTSARWTCSCARSISQFEQYVKLNRKVPPEILTSLAGIEQPGRLADTVAAHMSLKLDAKQKVLEIQDVRTRLEHILALIEGEMDVLQIEKRIRGRVKQQMEKSQREYYLNEQMKAIQKELGELDDAPNEIAELEKRIAARRHAEGSAREGDVGAQQAQAHVADVGRGDRRAQLHRLAGEVPVAQAHEGASTTSPPPRRCSNEDHFGLDKVKERIVEYLAVQQRVQTLQGPDPVPRRPARRRQDLARPEHRARDQPQVRAHVARRRA